MPTKTTAAEIAEPLEAGFLPVTEGEDRKLARKLFRLLADGEPVEIATLAAALVRPESEVSAALAGAGFEPLVYRDDRDRIIGFSGLAVPELGETVHRLRRDGGPEVYAWCAGDALFLPIALGTEMRIESRCPVTGEDDHLPRLSRGLSRSGPARGCDVGVDAGGDRRPSRAR